MLQIRNVMLTPGHEPDTILVRGRDRSLRVAARRLEAVRYASSDDATADNGAHNARDVAPGLRVVHGFAHGGQVMEY